MTAEKIGWEDILRQAEDLYKSMSAEGYICWQPACNPSDSKTPQNNFGENLTHFTN